MLGIVTIELVLAPASMLMTSTENAGLAGPNQHHLMKQVVVFIKMN